MSTSLLPEGSALEMRAYTMLTNTTNTRRRQGTFLELALYFMGRVSAEYLHWY